MKKIGIDEIFILSAMLDKAGDMGLPTKYRFIDKGDGVKEREEKSQEEYGLEVALMLFKKIHLIEKEVKQLIEKVFEKKPEDMGLVELKDSFIELMTQEGITSFFKSADNSTNSK